MYKRLPDFLEKNKILYEITNNRHSNGDIFMRILSTPMKRLYRNKKRNFCGGAVAGFVGGPDFFPFSDFLPVC